MLARGDASFYRSSAVNRALGVFGGEPRELAAAEASVHPSDPALASDARRSRDLARFASPPKSGAGWIELLEHLAVLAEPELREHLDQRPPSDRQALAELILSRRGPDDRSGPNSGWANDPRQFNGQLARGIKGRSSPPDRIYDTREVYVPGGAVGRLLQAIGGRESGAKCDAVDPHSGALGRYQVMPANVGPWSKEVLGQTSSPQQFLGSPELQDKIVGGKLTQYLEQGMASTGHQEGAVRYAAAKWYSGRGEKWNDERPQSYRGHAYPSIAKYTLSVYGRYQSVG